MARTEEEIILHIRTNYEQAINGIANYNTKIDELKAHQIGLKEELDSEKITLQEYQRAMAATKEQTKVYKEQVRVLSKEIQNNVREEKAQGDSLVALRSRLSNVTRQYDMLTKAERENANIGGKLKAEINSITDELKKAEGETERFYRNVGNYENSIKNALGLNNKFGNSLASLKELGGGNIMRGAVDSVKAFGGALKGLLANPAFLAVAGIAGAGMAFKWFYDYNKGLIESTRLTQEFTGLTGAALEDVRNSIQATSDMFGHDYLDTLRAVDSLMSQYHISAAEATQIVNDGFIAGADLSGDYLSKLQQYAPAFHDAGIAADEMVAIISQTRSGIFSDGGLDAIQMASKRIREMSSQTASALDAINISSTQTAEDLRNGTKSTFDVIQEISAKLREFPNDSQEVGAVLKDVFGKTAANEGLQMIETLDTMSTQLDEVKKQTGEYGELQEAQLEANKELNDVMSAMFDMSQNGFNSMISSVKLLATKWLISLMRGIIKVINYFIDLYNDSLLFRASISQIVGAFKHLWTTVKLVMNLIIDSVKGVGRSLRGLAMILEGILTFSLAKVKQGFSDLFSAVPRTMSESIGDIKAAGKEYANTFVDSMNKTMSGKLKHIEIVTGAGDGVGGGGAEIGGGTSGASSTGGGTSGKSKGGKSGGKSGGKGGANDAAKAIEQQAKAEREAVEKAQELMTKLIRDSYERQRQTINASYDKRIADIQAKLDTEKNLTEKTRNALGWQMYALAELRNRELAKLDDEHLRKSVEQKQRQIETYLAIVRKGSMDEYNLKVQQLNNEMELAISAEKASEHTEEEQAANILAIRAKFNNDIKALNDERAKAELDAIKQRYETQTLEMQTGGESTNPELDAMRIELEMRKELLDSAQQMELESDDEFHARKLALLKSYQEQERAVAEEEVSVQTAKAQAIGQVISGLGDIAEQYAEDNESLARLSKVLALSEIAINTGVALAEGIKQAQAVPFPGNLAAIATTVATILANIATAIKTVKSAKFATGGLVEGEGTGTSDSIPAMLSNGESVMTANATAMFAPALSVMNQLGGGVSIPSRQGDDVGMEYFATAFSRGLKDMPRPVVTVEEINKVKNNVEVIERRRNV